MPTGTQITNGFELHAPKPLDGRLGKFVAGDFVPYDDVAEANAAIDINYRHRSLVVLIGTPDDYVEYWYGAGKADSDLVVKVAGGNTLVVGAGEDYYTFAVGSAPTTDRTIDATFFNGTIFQFDGLIGKKIELFAGSQRLVPETDGYQFNSTTGIIETANTQSNVNLYVIAVNPDLQLTASASSLVLFRTVTADTTLLLADANGMVRVNSGSAANVTVPPNSSVAFPSGSQVAIRGVGAGDVTIVAGGGVTLNAGSLTISQYSNAVLHKVGTNEWDVAAGGTSSSIPQLSTPTLTATMVSDTEIDLSWTNVANESSYKLEWSANGTSGWTQIGGTIAANTTTYNHTGLTATTQYFYRVSAIGDGTTYSTSAYGTDDATTDAASSGGWTDLTVATSTQVSVVGHDYSGTTNNVGHDGFILFNEFIPSGQDGMIRFHVADGTCAENCLGFSTTNAQPVGLGGHNFGAYATGGNPDLVAVDMGSGAGTNISLIGGCWVIVTKIGTTVHSYRSNDGDALTTSHHTFSGTASGNIYIVASLSGNTARKLSSPQYQLL